MFLFSFTLEIVYTIIDLEFFMLRFIDLQDRKESEFVYHLPPPLIWHWRII